MMITKMKGIMHMREKIPRMAWKAVWVPVPKRFREKEPALIFLWEDP